MALLQDKDAEKRQKKYQDIFDAKKNDLLSSSSVVTSIDPDKRAENEKLSTITGVPLDVVERNVDEIKLTANQQKYARALGEESTPKLRNWLSNPENAAVSHDDVGILSTAENILNTPLLGKALLPVQTVLQSDKADDFVRSSENVIRGIGETAGGVGGRIVGFPRKVIESQYSVLEKEAPTIANIIDIYSKEVDKFRDITGLPDTTGLDKRLSQAFRGADFGFDPEAITSYEDLKKQRFKNVLPFMLENFAVSSPEMALAMANLPLAVLSTSTRVAEERAENLGLEDYTFGEVMDAMPIGLASAFLERFSARGMFGLDDVAVEGGKQLVKEAGKAALKEGSTEFIQEFMEWFGGTVGTDKELVLKEGLERGLSGAIVGVGAGGGIRTITAASELRQAERQAEQATERQEVFEAMADTANASKLRERLPERFRAFIESVTKDGAVETINIPADKFNEYFQENDPFDLSQEIPEVFEQVQEALATGGDIVIPIADFATYIAPSEHFDGLKGDMRLHADEMTLNEAIAFEEGKEALVDEMLAEEIEVDDTVFDNVYNQLREAGRSDVVARAEATSLTAFVDTMAERTGQTADEIYKSMGLTIQGPIPETLQARSVDEIDFLIDAVRGDKLPKQAEAFGPTLLEFAREHGIRDDRGDLAAMDIDKGKKAFVRNLLRDDGMPIDDVALAAQEAGFFEELGDERVTINQFLDAVSDELSGQEKRIGGDVEQQEQLQYADDLNRFLDERGIDIDTATNEEIKAALQEGIVEDEKLTLFQRVKAGVKGLFGKDEVQPFFSSVASAAEGLKQEKGSGQQFLAAIKKTAGVKEEEIIWIGLDEFLKGKKSVTKQEIIDYVDQNKLEIKEITKGVVDPTDAGYIVKENDLFVVYNKAGEAVAFNDTMEGAEKQLLRFADPSSQTKFGDYVLPNGKNYREVLLTMPEKGTDREIVDVLSGGKGQPYVIEYSDGVTEIMVGSEGWSKRLAFARAHSRLNDGLAKGEKEFKGGHFDEPNILAHVRLNDRVGPSGEKILFVEEIQSDWHQEGRKKGYVDPVQKKRMKELGVKERENSNLLVEIRKAGNIISQPLDRDMLNDLQKMDIGRDGTIVFTDTPNDMDNAVDVEASLANMEKKQIPAIKVSEELQDEIRALNEEGGVSGVPDAPLKKTWYEMAFRRVAHMAAEGGYDEIAWTQGEVQVDRYDLSKSIAELRYNKETGHLTAWKKVLSDEYQEPILEKTDLTSDELSSVVGKDVAEKLINGEPEYGGYLSLKGEELKVGGEGMKSFYDKILKNYANKFGKKFGAKVSVSEVQTVSKSNKEDVVLLDELGVKPEGKSVTKVWSLPVTDKMKETATAEGFPLFQKDGKAPRGSITFGDKETVIKLTESANLSTFLHESGHLYLETFKNIQENAPKQIQDDFKVILDWMGVKSGEKIGTEHHEQWARGFEAYLMEGKSPSVKLEGVFQRFRSWLVTVYRELKNLNVKLTPEIRSVMDRMLATDEEIAVANSQLNYAPLFDSAEGMTKAEFTAYEKAINQAENQAKDKVTRKTMNELKRAQKKWWKAEEEKTRKEVSDGVYNNKVYQAWHLLSKGRLYEGATPDEIAGIKLSKDALVDQYGKEILKYLPKNSYRIEGGYAPDQVADLFEISGEELVQGLINLPPPQKVIDLQVEATMKERHGDMLNDGGIQEEALAAVHNDKRGEVLALELKFLNRKLGKKEPSIASVAKAAAKRIIAGKKTNQAIQFGAYAAAETRAAQETEQFIAKNDPVRAAESKRKQILNHYMFMESKKAALEVEKILKYTGKFGRKGTRGNIDVDYLDQIDALLDRFEFKKGVSLKAIERRKALLQWAQAQEDKGYEVVIPDRLMNEAYRINYKDMSLEEVYGVRDSIKNIEHLGRKKQEYLRNKDKREYEIVRNEVVDRIYSSNKTLPKAGVADHLGEDIIAKKSRIKKAIADADAAHLKIERVIDWLDGGDPNGPANQAIFVPMAEAEAWKNDKNKEMAKSFEESMEKIPLKERQVWFRGRSAIPQLNGDRYQKGQLIVMALHSGTESNMGRIEDGHGYTREQVMAALNENLTEAEWKFVEEMWQLVGSLWPESSAAEKARTGVMPEKIEGWDVHTKFGVIKGDYFPIVYDGELSNRAKQISEKRADAFFENSYIRPASKSGSMIERLQSTGMPLLLDVNTIANHIQKEVHVLAYRDAITAVDKLTSDKAFAEAVNDTLGPSVHEMFRPWLHAIANDAFDVPAENFLGKVLARLRRGTTVMAMGLKISTAIQQPLGMTQSMFELARHGGNRQAAAWLGVGAKQFIKNPREAFKFVTEKSGEIRHRQNNFDRDVRTNLRALTYKSGTWINIQQSYFMMTAIMDMSVVLPTWIGAYNKGLKDFDGDEKSSIQFADKIVRLSQGTGSMKDLAGIQRGSELQRLFTMFYSYFNTYYNALRASGKRVKTEGGVPRFVADMFLITIIPALLSEIITGRGPDEDDEIEDIAKWAAVKAGTYPLMSVVGVRDLASYVGSSIDGKNYGYQLTPVTRSIETLGWFGHDVYREAIGEGDSKKTLKHGIETAGYIWGLPLKQPWITGDAIYNSLTDEEEVEMKDFFLTPQKKK